MKRFAFQKRLLILLLLENIVGGTFYNKHNLFHQRKLGRYVELQNRQIVLFKSRLDVMQFSTLSEQLSLGSELTDWYPDATSVSYGQLFIELSPRKDDRLRYYTNTDPFSQIFISRTDWNSQNFWTMNTQIFSTLQVFKSFSLNGKSLFLQSCRK